MIVSDLNFNKQKTVSLGGSPHKYVRSTQQFLFTILLRGLFFTWTKIFNLSRKLKLTLPLSLSQIIFSWHSRGNYIFQHGKTVVAN